MRKRLFAALFINKSKIICAISMEFLTRIFEISTGRLKMEMDCLISINNVFLQVNHILLCSIN